MSYITIHPCQKLINQPWHIPPSKSWTYRHIFSGIIGAHPFTVDNALYSNDIQTMLQSLGWKYAFSNEKLSVHPQSFKENTTIDVGNSGLALRFLIGYCASLSIPIIITGDHSICHQRPLKPLVNALRSAGVQISYLGQEGYAPVKILGPFQGGPIELEVLDSQYASALMLSGTLCPSPTNVKFYHLHEWPWLKLSHKWLTSLGADIHLTKEGMQIKPSPLNIPHQFQTPCDWSSAAFAIGAHIMSQSPGRIKGLDWPSDQGDSEIAHWLIQQQLGHFEQGDLHITPKPFAGQTLCMDHWIDATPIMSALLTQAKSKSRMTHLSSATQKECNRPQAIQSMLNNLGIEAEFKNNTLIIEPGIISAGSLVLDHDHRMTLSAMVLALGAKGPIRISPYHTIDKTYPQFINELMIRGVTVE
ncbi:MAG: hypothetical protein FJ186_02425 [Gammaproteobacteria bacterium]|nr:hypothetical protein [Gammaproteobacteria bacterium]